MLAVVACELAPSATELFAAAWTFAPLPSATPPDAEEVEPLPIAVELVPNDEFAPLPSATPSPVLALLPTAVPPPVPNPKLYEALALLPMATEVVPATADEPTATVPTLTPVVTAPGPTMTVVALPPSAPPPAWYALTAELKIAEAVSNKTSVFFILCSCECAPPTAGDIHISIPGEISGQHSLRNKHQVTNNCYQLLILHKNAAFPDHLKQKNELGCCHRFQQRSDKKWMLKMRKNVGVDGDEIFECSAKAFLLAQRDFDPRRHNFRTCFASKLKLANKSGLTSETSTRNRGYFLPAFRRMGIYVCHHSASKRMCFFSSSSFSSNALRCGLKCHFLPEVVALTDSHLAIYLN